MTLVSCSLESRKANDVAFGHEAHGSRQATVGQDRTFAAGGHFAVRRAFRSALTTLWMVFGLLLAEARAHQRDLREE